MIQSFDDLIDATLDGEIKTFEEFMTNFKTFQISPVNFLHNLIDIIKIFQEFLEWDLSEVITYVNSLSDFKENIVRGYNEHENFLKFHETLNQYFASQNIGVNGYEKFPPAVQCKVQNACIQFFSSLLRQNMATSQKQSLLMLMINHQHIRQKSLDVEAMKNLILRFIDRKFKLEYQSCIQHLLDQMNTHMNQIMNNRFLVKVEALLIIINNIIVDIDAKFLKQQDEQLIVGFQKNQYPIIYKLLKELVTLNLKCDINANVQLDDHTINLMSLESDTCISDKEIYNKKKGITKKTVFAAKVRELSVNMLATLARLNLAALYPHYFGMFENVHFENYPDMIFILLYDTFRKCQISTSNLLCIILDNYPIKNALYMQKQTDCIQLSKRKMKEIGLTKPAKPEERDQLNKILDIFMHASFVCLDREVNKYSYPQFLKFIVKQVETIQHGKNNLPLLTALLNTTVNKFINQFIDPKRKKETELNNLYSYFLKLISTLIYTIQFIEDSKMKFYCILQSRIENWSKFIKLILDKGISYDFQIEVIIFFSKICKVDLEILNEEKNYLKDIHQNIIDLETSQNTDWFKQIIATLKLIESIQTLEYPDTDKKFQSFLPQLKYKHVDKLSHFNELVIFFLKEQLIDKNSQQQMNTSDPRGLEIIQNIIQSLIIISEEHQMTLQEIHGGIIEKLLEVSRIKLDNRDSADNFNTSFINLKGSAQRALGNIISMNMYSEDLGLARLLQDSIKQDFVRGYANRVLFSRKLSTTLCSSIHILSQLALIESQDFQVKFEVNTNLLKQSVQFSNSDKEKVRACGQQCLGTLGVLADAKLFSKINQCNMPAFELVMTQMLNGISDKFPRVAINSCIALCSIIENRVQCNIDPISWLKAKDNLIKVLLQSATSLNKDFKLKAHIILVICKLREQNELIMHEECLNTFFSIWNNVKKNQNKNQVQGEEQKRELLRELVLAGIVQILVDVKQPTGIKKFIAGLGKNIISLIEAIYESSSQINSDTDIKPEIHMQEFEDASQECFSPLEGVPDFTSAESIGKDEQFFFPSSDQKYSRGAMLDQNQNNNMPRFLISDEVELSSSKNLFFDSIDKKREASNSLEKPAEKDKDKDKNEDRDRNNALSQNIGKKSKVDSLTIEIEQDSQPAEHMLVLNSPSERVTYDKPNDQVKSTINNWLNNRQCTNQMVSKLINFIESGEDSLVSFSVINGLKELKTKYEAI